MNRKIQQLRSQMSAVTLHSDIRRKIDGSQNPFEVLNELSSFNLSKLGTLHGLGCLGTLPKKLKIMVLLGKVYMEKGRAT